MVLAAYIAVLAGLFYYARQPVVPAPAPLVKPAAKVDGKPLPTFSTSVVFGVKLGAPAQVITLAQRWIPGKTGQC